MKEEIVEKLQYAFKSSRVHAHFFSQLYYEEQNSRVITEVIQENFEYILSKCSRIMLSSLLKELALHDDMYSFIENHTSLLLTTLKDAFIYVPCEFQNKDYINTHLLDVLGVWPSECFYVAASTPDFIEEDHREVLNSFLVDHKEEYVAYLLGKQLSYIYTKEQLEDFISVLTMLIDEVLEHEGLCYIDIKQLSQGSYSDVIEIGSKIIKVGGKKFCPNIPNSPYLLQPLIRVNLEDVSSIHGTLEVQEKVDSNQKISISEVYSLYENLRNQGIIWLDAKENNLGYLLTDNQYHYKRALGLDPVTRGLMGENKEILKSGELVVIDLDHLFLEHEVLEDSTIRSFFQNFPSYYYEELYQEQLKYQNEHSAIKEKTIKKLS